MRPTRDEAWRIAGWGTVGILTMLTVELLPWKLPRPVAERISAIAGWAYWTFWFVLLIGLGLIVGHAITDFVERRSTMKRGER